MIELFLLGGIRLREEGTWNPHPLLSHPKCVALLAFLAAARPRGCHRRDKLLGLFWPDLDEGHARGALRKTLFLIRKEGGKDVLRGLGTEDIGVNFERLRCDVVEFRQALEEGELELALRIYGGDFMDGFHLGEWHFDEWVAEEGRECRGMAARCGWALAVERERRGWGMDAARWARLAAGLAPFDEMAHQRLLLTLDRLGDRAGALREHREFARRLESELELSPSPETVGLVEEIRTRSRPRGTLTQNLTHRLADMPSDGRGGGTGPGNGRRSVAVVLGDLRQAPQLLSSTGRRLEVS